MSLSVRPDEPTGHAGPDATAFPGDTEMARRCRAHDWVRTSLGPVDTWSAAQRATVALVLESMLPGCVCLGASLVLVYNDAARGWLDAERHPWALGRPAHEVWPELWPVLGPEYAQVLTGGPPVAHADRRLELRRDGVVQEIFATYALSPLRDADGHVFGVHTIAIETTGAYRTGRTLEALMDGSPAVMAVYSGPAHVVTYVNDMWRRLLGRADAIGRPFRDVFPEMASSGLAERLDEVYASGERFEVAEFPLPLRRSADGPVEASYWSFTWQPLAPFVTARVHGDGGGTTAPPAPPRDILLQAVDVTAQVHARHEVERLLAESESSRAEAEEARRHADQARRAAEEAGRAKADFLAAMSHEIRTPINAILGYAELLDLELIGPLTPTQRDYLARLLASGRHLLGLVTDVLDVARAEAELLRIVPVVAHSGPVIAAAIDMVRPQAEMRGVRLVDTRPGEEGEAFVGDEGRVRQVLVNLLTNAVKFTPPGGRVTIDCRGPRSLAAGGDDAGAPPTDVTITVTDTGAGIAPADHARIFEPFVQGDARAGDAEAGDAEDRDATAGGGPDAPRTATYTMRHAGAGLGLAISRQLARRMDGDLTLDRSAPGEGSSFTLRLPAPPRTADDATTAVGTDATGDARVAAALVREPPTVAVAGLADLGALLREHVDAVLRDWTTRLLDDPATRDVAHGLSRAQLEDHQATYATDLAQSLVIVGEPATSAVTAAALLRDGSAIQRTVAEHHGRCRHAQGWSLEAVDRDHVLLREALETLLRERLAVDGRTAEPALAMLRQLLARGRALSVTGWRQAEGEASG